MKLKSFLLCLLLGAVLALNAQDLPTCYRISLTDKVESPFSLDNPLEYLSERALAKRERFNIPITEQDLPINPQYVQQIRQIDPRIYPLCHSKWMNTVTIYCPDSTKLSLIQQLPFVSEILPVANYNISIMTAEPAEPLSLAPSMVSLRNRDSIVPLDYGYGYEQIAIHNGQLLHNLGFRGDSMLIVVLDGGWDGVDTSAFFSPLFQNGQVWGTRDLIPWRNNVYEGHPHGTIVTSTMAGQQETVLVGTAPNANYFFIRTEETEREELIEEDFWAQGAEIADSLGADVINSSLGYTLFADFPECTYTYAQTDGVTSIASRAATILAQKGVVVCVSAGNDGMNAWHYIGHPADAIDILTVGAADIYGNVASFSSRGPSVDGRVKPDITSVGVSTVCMYPDDYLGTANGTSLAGPVAAGLCACLWQALPEASSTQIMQYIRESSSCYNNPNDSLGYGIPDFYVAYTQHVGIDNHPVATVEAFPNPCTNYIQIANIAADARKIEIYANDGKMVKQLCPKSDYLIRINVEELPAGFYVGKVMLRNRSEKIFKFVKK